MATCVVGLKGSISKLMPEFTELKDWRSISLKEWMHRNRYIPIFNLHVHKKTTEVVLAVTKDGNERCRVKQSFDNESIESGHFVGSMLHKAFVTLVDPDSARK